MARRHSYRDDPTWLFTLKLGTGDRRAIIIRAFELVEQPDRTRDYITVELRHGQRVVFERGALWTGSPAAGWRDGLDGRCARAAVLALVAMAPGDTDAEYFEGYTNEQRAWAAEYADVLASRQDALRVTQ